MEFKLTNHEILVLHVLKDKGDLAVFEIHDNLDIQVVRIYSIVKNLIKKKLIKLVGVERRKKMGRPNSIYAVTNHGLDLLNIVKRSQKNA